MLLQILLLNLLVLLDTIVLVVKLIMETFDLVLNVVLVNEATHELVLVLLVFQYVNHHLLDVISEHLQQLLHIKAHILVLNDQQHVTVLQVLIGMELHAQKSVIIKPSYVLLHTIIV